MQAFLRLRESAMGAGLVVIPKQMKAKKGRFSKKDGRYHMGLNEVLTIATHSGCLVQIVADIDGQVSEVNICAMRDREVKLTLNGLIK